MSPRCLSIPAAYRCRRGGACCSDIWVVPAEDRVLQLVERRQIEGPAREGPLFVRTPYPEIGRAPFVLAQPQEVQSIEAAGAR